MAQKRRLKHCATNSPPILHRLNRLLFLCLLGSAHPLPAQVVLESSGFGYVSAVASSGNVRLTSSFNHPTPQNTQAAGIVLNSAPPTLAPSPSGVSWNISPGLQEESSQLVFGVSLLWDDGRSSPVATPQISQLTSQPDVSLGGNTISLPAVYQNELLQFQITAFGQTTLVTFTIENNLPDNFGPFAGNGLPDDWEVDNYGLNPPSVPLPTADEDFDGYSQLQEFLLGTGPAANNARFTMQVSPVGSQWQVRFEPFLNYRTYVLETLAPPSHQWQSVTPASSSLETGTQFAQQQLLTVDRSAAPSGIFRLRVSLP